MNARPVARCAALVVATAAGVIPAFADQDTATAGQTASVQLDFQVNIYKFVMLRVGATDATATPRPA